MNDTASCLSGFSVGSSATKENEDSYSDHFDPTEDPVTVDDFESKLESVLDLLQSSRSGKQRAQHFASLNKALTIRYCADYLENSTILIQDVLEQGLKRNSNEELQLAATTLAMILVTMGTSDLSENLMRSLYEQLYRIINDHGASPYVRARCALALALGTFITDYGMEINRKVVDLLAQIALSPTKASGGTTSADCTPLHVMKAAFLEAFSFLISVETDSFVFDSLNTRLPALIQCLDTPNLAVKVAAGECIALLVEKSREADEDFELDMIDDVCEKLQMLATESQKSRSKKELREQRSNFRQILKTVQGENFGKETVKFGQERLVIQSWETKRLYDTFCSVVGSGMNMHLSGNILLRDIFGLGAVPLDDMPTTKVSKFQKVSFLDSLKTFPYLTYSFSLFLTRTRTW